jgi:peptidoglycan/LPS O-acetylase OafA/YrhL
MKIAFSLKDRNNNFTLIRFFAAFSVLYGHSYALSLGVNGSEDPISRVLINVFGESLPSFSVNLFFVSSGFLVSASYIQRESLIAFIEARILRIFPALIVAVLFCVFIIGAFATTDSLPNYFLSPTTLGFFKHNAFLVAGIQFDLPNVFLGNPILYQLTGLYGRFQSKSGCIFGLRCSAVYPCLRTRSYLIYFS